MRGPLDVLKESWEAGGQCATVVEHVLLMREKLSQMTELVKQNLLEAQRKQKTWYDSHVRSREFRDGDLVLVLLPSSSNKLLAQWQGPYQVVRRCGKVTYMVDMNDKSKRRRIFHVNMLKGFNVHRSAESNYSVEEGSEGCLDGSSDIPVWNEKHAGGGTKIWTAADWYSVSAGTRLDKGV